MTYPQSLMAAMVPIWSKAWDPWDPACETNRGLQPPKCFNFFNTNRYSATHIFGSFPPTITQLLQDQPSPGPFERQLDTEFSKFQTNPHPTFSLFQSNSPLSFSPLTLFLPLLPFSWVRLCSVTVSPWKKVL